MYLPMSSKTGYQHCNHCEKLLSKKSYDEHRKLYYDELTGTWLRNCQKSDDTSSGSSSLPVSMPHFQEDHGDSSSGSSSEMICGDDGVLVAVDDSDIDELQDKKCILEYWDERDSDIDADFSVPDSLSSRLHSNASTDENLDQDEHAIVWWIVCFTCLFQTLYSLSSRAVMWLLKFLKSLLVILGLFSSKINKIAAAFPATLYLRNHFISEIVATPNVCRNIVCPECLSLYKFYECLEKRGKRTLVKLCSECAQLKRNIPLLKTIVTSNKSTRYYPFLVYPTVSLISSLEVLLSRPGFLHLCEKWRSGYVPTCECLSDMYCGRIWKEFLCFQGRPFLQLPNSIGLMLNIDWFQPFKHRTYSIGVIYLAIINLPRTTRFKRENIIIVGLIPGPSEPSKYTINTFLTPLVSELLELWNGVSLSTHDKGMQVIRGALLCVACDLPACRKVCGFLGHSANLGCSKCHSNFGTGVFGQQNYFQAGFDRSKWRMRTNERHRQDVKKICLCSTKSMKQQKESELGCRYSCLLQLPYFDVVRMHIIDPMHNLFLGTAKHIFHSIWVKREIIDTNALEVINNRIQSLVVPPEVRFSHLPACIEHKSSFTAEQWMIWVNYYSLYCLFGILSPEEMECWRHFVLASRLLCKKTPNSVDIRLADALLLRFCTKFGSLYGGDSVTPNMHLHAHLRDCVEDYGPIISFWLFSFERYNGLLGNEPTNNRSIEVQLVKRFLNDNGHLQLFASMPRASDKISREFSSSVMEHAYSFTSTKHLDVEDSMASISDKLIPATKYVISSFSDSEMDILQVVYREVYPQLYSRRGFQLCLSFKKMTCVTISGQKIHSGQFILAKSVFRFPGTAKQLTFDTRPAKIEYFFVHSVQVEKSECEEFVDNTFAVVSWPMNHPLRHSIGKPFEIWCHSAFENCDKNAIIPITNYVSLLLTAHHPIQGQKVLITVSLLL